MALTMINHHQESPTASQHRYASSNCTKHYQAPSSIHNQHHQAVSNNINNVQSSNISSANYGRQYHQYK